MGSGVNLIPIQLQAARRERKLARRGLLATAGYLTVLLGGTLGYLGLSAGRVPSAESTTEPTIALAVADENVARLKQQTAQTRSQWIETARRVEGSRVLSERPDWGTLLRLFAQYAGPEIVLGELAIQTTGPTITAGAVVRVGGVATDTWNVSAYVLRLEACGLFDQVTITASRREPYRDTSATAFTLECELRGSNDATGAKP